MIETAKRLRIRHALRVGVGGAIIHSLSVQLPVALGCGAPIFFYISTIAGTPEGFEGFQLCSATLTFWGVLIADITFSVIIAIAGSSLVLAFFSAMPVIFFFALFRTDRSLLPLPIVATMFTGFLVISKIGISRSEIPLVFAWVLLDGFVAYIVTIFINTVLFPDRATDEGRRILACHLGDLGAGLSAAGSRVFSKASAFAATNAAPLLSNDSDEEQFLHESEAVTKPGARVLIGSDRERHNARFLGQMSKIRPFGYTQVRKYACLTRAEQLFSVAKCEPTFLSSNSLRWRNNDLWKEIISGISNLTTEVAALESAILSAGNSGLNFSRESALRIFGEAYFPLWTAHFASCAAACAAMSSHLKNDSCSDMFCLPHTEKMNTGQSQQGDTDLRVKQLHGQIDPRRWKHRRAEMYLGVLLRYRTKWCDLVEARDLPSASAGMRPEARPNNDDAWVEDSRFTEPQALISFSISSHAIAEGIERIQKTMAELAQSKSQKSLKAWLFFLYMPAALIAKRFKKIVRVQLHAWELRFVVTQTLMLLFLLALALFVPGLLFNASEVAWVFTSAVLSTQLTAEPTLFVGFIRVFATILGAVLAFIAELLLREMGRSTNVGLQYLLVPYLMAIGIGSLLLFPPKFRYAAFLTVLTTSLVSFCPQTSSDCNLFVRNSQDCYPTLFFTLFRAGSVILGVICALGFHFFFWPRFAQKEARSILSKALLDASRLFGDQRRMYFYGTDPISGDSANLTKVPTQLERTRAQSNLNDHERLYKTVTMVDIYPNPETELSKRIIRDVDCRLRSALVLVGDASVWKHGPMKISPMLPIFYDDFVSLSVSLHQMATLLNRVPLLTGAYGRSAIDKYIAPCLYEYETVQISLHSIVNSTSRAITERSRRSLENSYADLVRCTNHLAEAREELARARATRACSSVAKAENVNGVYPSPSDDLVTSNLYNRELSFGSLYIEERTYQSLSPAAVPLRRSRSFDDNLLRKGYSDTRQVLRADDAVLFVSFSFAATSCLNAFARIVRHVLEDIEKILSLSNGGRKWYRVHRGRPISS